MLALKFYGSCGHIEIEETTQELFDRYSKHHGCKVTTENDVKIVHVHPLRYCSCSTCMEAVIKDYD